ncbi:MAG: hypothetical protein KKB21_01530 [Nanoarchaeota archaeon]|nr:hypothetical protein [Nanoarchaeota archaeon]MBU4086237.1 hypothetical protein [Nanoarchaeota archaeon]
MKKIAIIFLILSLVGIFLLLLAFLYPSPKQVSGKVTFNENDYSQVSGKIVSVKELYEFKIITLDNGIAVVCYDCPKLKKNQKITAFGAVTQKNNITQINAETIKIEE